MSAVSLLWLGKKNYIFLRWFYHDWSGERNYCLNIYRFHLETLSFNNHNDTNNRLNDRKIYNRKIAISIHAHWRALRWVHNIVLNRIYHTFKEKERETRNCIKSITKFDSIGQIRGDSWWHLLYCFRNTNVDSYCNIEHYSATSMYLPICCCNLTWYLHILCDVICQSCCITRSYIIWLTAYD